MAKETRSRAEVDAGIKAMVEELRGKGIVIDVQRQLLDVKAEKLYVHANVFPPAPVASITITIGEPEK